MRFRAKVSRLQTGGDLPAETVQDRARRGRISDLERRARLFRPAAFGSYHGEIECRAPGNLELYTLFGFASADDLGAWTIRPFAGLSFQSAPVASDVRVTIEAEPFTAGDRVAAQRMTLEVNGREVFSCTLARRGTVEARIPASVWNFRTPVKMVFHLPNAVSPHQLNMSIDDRMLGWHITQIAFRTAP